MADFTASLARFLSASAAYTHVGDASVRHDRFYVCKVHIDQSKIGNQIGYTLNALSEHVVSHVERLQHGRILSQF